MSELTEALASLEASLKASLPTLEQIAEAAASKLLPMVDSAVKTAVANAGPIGAIGSIVADPLIDDADAYVQGLLSGIVPPTTAPPLTVDALAKKVAALTVATGASGSHALAVASASVAKLPAPVPKDAPAAPAAVATK